MALRMFSVFTLVFKLGAKDPDVCDLICIHVLVFNSLCFLKCHIVHFPKVFVNLTSMHRGGRGSSRQHLNKYKMAVVNICVYTHLYYYFLLDCLSDCLLECIGQSWQANVHLAESRCPNGGWHLTCLACLGQHCHTDSHP